MNKILLITSTLLSVAKSDEAVNYGLDMSFAHLDPKAISTNFPWLPHNSDPENNPTVPDEHVNKTVQVLGDRKKVYEDYIQGCRDYWENQWGNDGRGSTACDRFEKDRFIQSLHQPKAMVNFTDVGYKKIRAPEHIYKIITEFWEANKDNESNEDWRDGNSFVNYWENPSTMVSVENSTLIGGGAELHDTIWNVTKDLISAWTGQELEGSSLYGIRIYKEGAILAPHVDRLPLISSAIINVAQDVDEEWPLEVFGHDGVVRNVTMQPGDMVLYESHSVIHGRPFALKGRYFANIFIHFMPLASEAQLNEGALPPYILEGSTEAKSYYEGGYVDKIPGAPRGLTEEPNAEPNNHSLNQKASHTAAAYGDIEILTELANENKEILFAEDNNGWMPIHEATRSGKRDAIEFLVKQGADLNFVTGGGSGYSPLDIALEYHDEDFISWLKNLGAAVINYNEEEEDDDDYLEEDTMRSEL